MTSFMSFQATAAARGDGLRPELLARLVGTAAPSFDLTTRSDGMIQSDPDLESEMPAPPRSADLQMRVDDVVTSSARPALHRPA